MAVIPSAASLESRLLGWIAGPESADPAGFEEILLAVHRHQRAANPAYDRYCAALPAARTWREIPALPQRVFKQQAVCSFPREAATRTFRTSGTTGEGYGEHHFPSLQLYRAAATRGWELAGFARRRVLALVPPVSEAPYSSLSQMASWLCPEDSAFFVRGGAGQWERLESAVRQADEPIALFGTALAFLGWMEHLGDRRLALPEDAILVETGGYKGSSREIPKADFYALLAERLGTAEDRIFNEYGMTELSSQFYAQGAGSAHRGAPWVRALVIDPETGREVADGATGMVRVFDAANLWSVCAVQTQDLAIRRGEDFDLIGRDPNALPRGCSRAADEMLLTEGREGR